MIHLIPVQGARVRDPQTKKIVGSEGVKISEMNTFWFRRLRDKEVIEAPQNTPAAQPKKEKKGE